MNLAQESRVFERVARLEEELKAAEYTIKNLEFNLGIWRARCQLFRAWVADRLRLPFDAPEVSAIGRGEP